MAASDAECLQAQMSCKKKCPVSPKQKHDDCVKVCDSRALACYMGIK